MNKFFLCLSLFFLVFCAGMGFVLFKNTGRKNISSTGEKRKLSLREQAKKIAEKAVATDAPRHLLPLLLPLDMTAERCTEKSWEFSGRANGTLVSVRGRLISSIYKQGWRSEKKISLDETLAPQEILTFRKNKYELILMLWKISGNMTGFAYRRDLQDKTMEKVIQ